MRPVPPEGWVNKMDEVEIKPKKKKQDGPTWHSGICSCCDDDPLIATVGCFAPCILFGMAKQKVGESLIGNSVVFLLTLSPCFALCFFRENIRSQYAIVSCTLSLWILCKAGNNMHFTVVMMAVARCVATLLRLFASRLSWPVW